MQLAADQFTCRIKVTGVGGGLRHDVERDLAEAVERVAIIASACSMLSLYL